MPLTTQEREDVTREFVERAFVKPNRLATPPTTTSAPP